VNDAQFFVFRRAKSLLHDWKSAMSFRQPSPNVHKPSELVRWKKPMEGRYKCNIDASFSKHLNRVGVGMCI